MYALPQGHAHITEWVVSADEKDTERFEELHRSITVREILRRVEAHAHCFRPAIMSSNRWKFP